MSHKYVSMFPPEGVIVRRERARVVNCRHYTDGPKVRVQGSNRDYRTCLSERSPRLNLPVCPCDRSTHCNPNCPGYEPSEDD